MYVMEESHRPNIDQLIKELDQIEGVGVLFEQQINRDLKGSKTDNQYRPRSPCVLPIDVVSLFIDIIL